MHKIKIFGIWEIWDREMEEMDGQKEEDSPGKEDSLGLQVGLQTFLDLVQQGVVVLESLQ